MSRPTTTLGDNRLCVLCGEWLLLENFYTRKGYKGRIYHSSYCKPCNRLDTQRRHHEYNEERRIKSDPRTT